MLITNRLRYSFFSFPLLSLPVFFHCAHHTIATLNISLGIPIEMVTKLMGYTKITSMKVYSKLIADKKREAVDRQNGMFD